MKALLATILAALSIPAAAESPEQLATADRFVAAIHGEVEFSTVGFLEAPSKDELALYSRLKNCKVRYKGAPTVPHPEKRRKYVEVPNELWLTFACKGISMRNPIILELKFDEARITDVMVINADRLKD